MLSRVFSRRLLQRSSRGGSLARQFVPTRRYNFASSQFRSAFGGLPVADGVKLRADTIKYLYEFDPKTWYE